jgi:hypothetical protein
MPFAPEPPPVYTGAGLITETATGRRAHVTVAYHPTEDGGLEVRMMRGDGTPAPPGVLSAEKARLLGGFLFPPGPGTGEPRRVIPDPVNLDGSPRNHLRDRLARRGFENLAAIWVVTMLGGVCLGHC